MKQEAHSKWPCCLLPSTMFKVSSPKAKVPILFKFGPAALDWLSSSVYSCTYLGTHTFLLVKSTSDSPCSLLADLSSGVLPWMGRSLLTYFSEKNLIFSAPQGICIHNFLQNSFFFSLSKPFRQKTAGNEVGSLDPYRHFLASRIVTYSILLDMVFFSYLVAWKLYTEWRHNFITLLKVITEPEYTGWQTVNTWSKWRMKLSHI